MHRLRTSPKSDSASQSTGPDALEETLGRLSKKPGVKAAIALDRASGTVLKTSGLVSSVRKAKLISSSLPTQSVGSFSSDAGVGPSEHLQDEGVQELAALVWNFVGTAGSLVQELDTEVPLHMIAHPLAGKRPVTDALRRTN